MDRPRLAALEQAAVVEEHVDELPEHVVERLHELLPDGRVGCRRVELPFRADRREAERQAASLARNRDRLGDLPGAEADRDVVRLGEQGDLPGERPALAGEAEGGQRPLADYHRVYELDGHVPCVRAGRGRLPERDQAPPAREALRHPVAEPREALGLGVEEVRVRAGAVGQRGRE